MIRVYWFTGKDLEARIIQMLDKTKYNHVGITVGFNYFESTAETGVRRLIGAERDEREADATAYAELVATPEQEDALVSWLFQQVGKEYSGLGIVSLALSILLRIPIIVYGLEQWWCSQLVAFGLHISESYAFINPDSETPGSLARRFKDKLIQC